MKKVIAAKNLPVKFPVCGLAVSYLLLDKFNAPSWICGVVFTLFALAFVACVAVAYKSRSIDIFK